MTKKGTSGRNVPLLLQTKGRVIVSIFICIYFHCAVEGQKIDNIKQNKFVSFCAVGNTEILPEKFGTKYESVIVAGEVEEVFDTNKQLALEGRLHKYSPEFIEKGLKYIEGLEEKTRVFKIAINKLTGKARKQLFRLI